jgi:hypothetical protein
MNGRGSPLPARYRIRIARQGGIKHEKRFQMHERMGEARDIKKSTCTESTHSWANEPIGATLARCNIAIRNNKTVERRTESMLERTDDEIS